MTPETGSELPVAPVAEPDGEAHDLKSLLERYERNLILGALVANAWHQRRAARALGILPTTLHEKMKRLGIASAGRRS